MENVCCSSDRVFNVLRGKWAKAIAMPCGTSRGCGVCGAQDLLSSSLAPVGVVAKYEVLRRLRKLPLFQVSTSAARAPVATA